jgi:hypothetical protein
MIDDKRMNEIRAARGKLRELQSVFEGIALSIDDDVTLLPERLWWTEIEDDMHAVSNALDAVDQSFDEALSSIAEITGEDEPELANFMPPLPFKLPSKEEVFVARRNKAAVLRAQRGGQQ